DRPPLGSGSPPSRILIWPCAPPSRRRLSSTIAPPDASCCETVPDRLAENRRSRGPFAELVDVAVVDELATACAPSSVSGVPARRAQPGWKGPTSVNRAKPATVARDNAPAPARIPSG